jgi:hypothetical protein
VFVRHIERFAQSSRVLNPEMQKTSRVCISQSLAVARYCLEVHAHTAARGIAGDGHHCQSFRLFSRRVRFQGRAA